MMASLVLTPSHLHLPLHLFGEPRECLEAQQVAGSLGAFSFYEIFWVLMVGLWVDWLVNQPHQAEEWLDPLVLGEENPQRWHSPLQKMYLRSQQLRPKENWIPFPKKLELVLSLWQLECLPFD